MERHGKIEAIARAMHAARCGYPWERAAPMHRTAWMTSARVALDAICPRSPQDEDHEADINRILWNRLRTVLSNVQIMSIAAEIADRVSPSRDGSVAVENVVERLREAAAFEYAQDHHKAGDTFTIAADFVLTEFSRSSTDNQPQESS
jgi:hypothetical protein